MATTPTNNGIEIKEDERNKKFNVGDHVKFTNVSALPDSEGIIEKKYNNSALIAFKPNDVITQQMYEELNGRYVVNYDNLKVIKNSKKK
ncbi:MAG: hypothetical protein H9901_00710 [Candidatus Paralactobacillus gallistercoris]|uniref:DUF2187 domain-containing protein n=1 Tax=Candidatus Paralactobacillus gallistercoris TaxID=2838724 RepID=A0A948X0S1_9LACO|nr:hypothetical protein [Candidatus Paralactobacillus gallistercoris]